MKDKLHSGICRSDPAQWDIRVRTVFCSIQGRFGRLIGTTKRRRMKNKYVSFKVSTVLLKGNGRESRWREYKEVELTSSCKIHQKCISIQTE